MYIIPDNILTSMQKIRIGDEDFELNLQKKTIRSVRLRIKEKNVLEMSVPWLTPKIIVKKFIRDSSAWIIKQNKKVKQKINLDELRTVEILGERFEIESKYSSRDSLVIMANRIYVNYSDKGKLKEILDKKMRRMALKIIKENVERLAGKFGLKYTKVGVKNQSSRFGSCSHSGSLNFNWQIILFPVDKFEHVILHELTHLIVKNHSRDFWKLLESFDNRAIENNKWLKKEGTRRFIV